MGRYERSAGMSALMNQGANLLLPRTTSDTQSSPDPSTTARPYDDPDIYNSGDIAMENMPASPLPSPNDSTRGDQGGTYLPLGEPSGMQALDNISLLSNRSRYPNTKHFDQNQARKRILFTGGFRLLITILFSAMICIALRAWEGNPEPIVLSRTDVQWFNAMTIGLSLGLGLNLLASLQNHASILRWSLLSRGYVSLEAFDLILGIEKLSNVVKLMLISLPLIRRQKYLRKLTWFNNARQDGTKSTWLVCLLWLGVNIGSQALVAVSSLFYPLDPSDSPILTSGNVTVAYLKEWAPTDPLKNYTAMLDAWTFGMEGQRYPVFAPESIQNDLSKLWGMPLYKIATGTYEYRFFNRNPDSQNSNYVLLSNRSITATAECSEAEVGGDGSFSKDEDADMYYLKVRWPGQGWGRYYRPVKGSGGTSWSAWEGLSCGSRCTNFTVLQQAINLGGRFTVNKTSLFACNNTVSEIRPSNNKNDINVHTQLDREVVWGSDNFARVAAGAMGWTGLPSWDDMARENVQTRSWSPGSNLSPASVMSSEQVADMIAHYTIGAIAAFDHHGTRYNITNQQVVPSSGQELNVDWPYLLGILGGICMLQFTALSYLLVFAKRTIIRDESFLSLAMLLSPVVGRIGKEEGGMNMSGDEIKNHPKLQFRRIQYSYREGKNGEPHQVDILWEGKDGRESRKSWVPGIYN